MVRALSPRDQDEIARVIIQLAGPESAEAIPLSWTEGEAVDRSRAAAARGEFATDEQIQGGWAKRGV